MFDLLMRKAAIWLAKKQTEKMQDEPEKEEKIISKRLAENLKAVRDEIGDSKDIVIREFTIYCGQKVHGAIVFVDGLVNSKIINDNIIKPLMYDSCCGEKEEETNKNLLEIIQNTMLSVGEVEVTDKLDIAINGFLSGDTVLLAEGMEKGLIINSKGWEKRGIESPASEAVVRGPRESFTENLRTNTALIRRKIKAPELTIEAMIVGKRTKTNISLAYIKGVAKSELIDEIKRRISTINTDSILESGYIEQYIEDSPGSIFATIGYTEKPDVAAAKILEGRVAILVDGTPFVLTAPLLFIEHFQSAEDYYFRPYFATFIRVIRIISFSITILAPALYVSITTFHQELIPRSLLLTMAKAREGVPFPALFESLIMIVTFEILREAGIRLPRPVGQALSIVGALVIGEAAVSAGLIGAPMVIVVAITAVSGFVVPNEADSAVILRIILLVMGASFGGFGLTIGLLGILVHMTSLESFGYQYLSPAVPFDAEDSKDAIIRAPLWMMIGRPKGMSRDKKRREFMIPPAKGKKDENKGN